MTETKEPNVYCQMLDGWDEAHWVQRVPAYRDRVCLLIRYARVSRNAINMYVLAPREYGELASLASVIAEQYPRCFYDSGYPSLTIAKFNDHRRTTFADIQLVLEKAAIRYEERVLAGAGNDDEADSRYQ